METARSILPACARLSKSGPDGSAVRVWQAWIRLPLSAQAFAENQARE